jgi:hypothetical protein
MKVEDVVNKLHWERLAHATAKAMKDAGDHEASVTCCSRGTDEAGDKLYGVSRDGKV